MKIKVFPIMVIVFILLIVAGTIYFVFQNNSANGEQAQEIKYETVTMVTNLHLGISNYDTIMPYQTTNREVIYLDQLIFEPLLTITQDYELQPCLAQEFSKTDEKTYLIKLKENIKWQNNNDFTANDVKFSITTLQKMKNSIYYENVKDIKNVEIIDDTTLKIELEKEIPFFEYQLIFPILSVKQYNNKNVENSKEIPIGTGKYKIASINKETIKLTKNEAWRNIETENANIKTITVSIYETMGDVYNAFKLGNIDFLHTNNENAENYIGTMGYQKKVYAGRQFDYLALNCESTVLKYKEVRQAIKAVLNIDQIADITLEGKVMVAPYLLEENHYLLGEITKRRKPNLEVAQNLLKECGWEYEYGIWQKEIDGRTRTLNITLSVNKKNSDRIKVAKEIQKQLKTLGIEVTIEEISETSYQNYLKNHNYELLITGMNTPLAPTLDNYFGKNNLANYKNVELQNIMTEISNITQKDTLVEKYQRVWEILEEDVPYISLYRNKEILAYSTNFIGEVEPNNYSYYYNFANWYMQ